MLICAALKIKKSSLYVYEASLEIKVEVTSVEVGNKNTVAPPWQSEYA